MERILHIVESLEGGILTYLSGLVNCTCNQYEVTVAYSTRPTTPTDFQSLFDSRVRFIKVVNFTRDINFVKDAKAFFEIRRIVRDTAPDIVHLHSSKAGFLGRMAINGKRIKLFYTPNGYSFLMQNCSIVKLQCYKAMEAIAGQRKCLTIASSKSEYEESKKVTKWSTCINNGIDIDILQSLLDKNRSMPEFLVNNGVERPLRIFTVGRICEQKNPYLFNRIAMQFPNTPFYWIGDGDLKEKLTSPNITVTGWLDREQVVAYADNMDVFLLTSLWEGLPLALLEAMYMKKLCVVSNAVGNRDVIKNGYNGHVCDDEGSFIKAMQFILENGIDAKLIQRAHDDILKEYNTRVMAGSYINKYRKS